MRLLSLLSVFLIVCLVAIALPEAPAQAQGAELLLSPNSGVPGEEVTVYGHDFTEDTWVDIYYYFNGSRIWVAEDETDGDGDFRVDFIVPESYTGSHEVFAEDEYDVDDYAYFTVEPGLTVSPEEGPVGTTVTVEGHGFDEDEESIELRYYFNGDFETIDDDITADDDGWWELSFQIPPSAQGHRGHRNGLPRDLRGHSSQRHLPAARIPRDPLDRNGEPAVHRYRDEPHRPAQRVLGRASRPAAGDDDVLLYRGKDRQRAQRHLPHGGARRHVELHRASRHGRARALALRARTRRPGPRGSAYSRWSAGRRRI